MFKHMNNESALSDTGFKNRVIDILSGFDQFESKIWRRGGRYITITFRTAQYEGAEELAKLITRTFNDQLKGYRAELIGTGSLDGKWFADVKFKKLDDMRESLDPDDKLLGDYICTRSFRHGNMGKVCRKGYRYKVDEIAPDGRVVINGYYVDLDFLNDHFEKVEDKEMTIEEAKVILNKSGKKAINESYLEQVNVEELYSLALEALFFADQVHLWHWTCKSGFHHTHLQAVYESLRDFADELVEVCLASGKKFAVKANTRTLGGDGDFDVQDAIDELEEFIDQIQATAKVFDEESEITTLLDDEAKTLTKEVGLLKTFS